MIGIRQRIPTWPENEEQLQEFLDASDNPVPGFRQALRKGTDHLFARYDAGVPVGDLVRANSRLVDMLLREA